MAPQAPRPGLAHTPPHVTARFVASGALARVFPPDLVAALRDEAGLDPAPLSADELRAGAAADCDALFATWGMPALSEAELAAALPRLRAVFYAAGSVQAFARPLLACGVAVFSAWAQNAVPVAEMAVSQILLANKGFFRFRFGPKDPAAGEAERHAAAAYPGNLGCRVGLLGAGGRIGSLVARALREHRVEVLGYDPFLPDARAAELGVRKAGLEEIFGTCQTVSNHLADNPATRGLLGYALFSRMLPTATFLNTGRGAQVVETDLARALREEPGRTAVLDVTFPEPPAADSPLRALPNVLLTPHFAGSSGGEVRRMGEAMLVAFRDWRVGRPSPTRVDAAMLETMA